MGTTRPPEREELAAFLRAQRSKLTPEQVGLPRGSRRRTSGLRREEVAQLAGVGVSWYTWLEQAKDIRVSAQFLERLAMTLRLNGTEKRHLFALCGVPLSEAGHSVAPEISENQKRVVDAIPGPAYYMTTRRWDMVYWNAAVEALCGPLKPQATNAMELVFLDAYHRSLMVDWEPWARTTVAKFKLDVAPVMNEPDVVELIEKLKRGSPQFRDWWPALDVVGWDESTRVYTVPGVGRLVFTPSAFIVEHRPGLRLRAFTARDAHTAAKVRDAVERYHRGRRPIPR